MSTSNPYAASSVVAAKSQPKCSTETRRRRVGRVCGILSTVSLVSSIGVGLAILFSTNEQGLALLGIAAIVTLVLHAGLYLSTLLAIPAAVSNPRWLLLGLLHAPMFYLLWYC